MAKKMDWFRLYPEIRRDPKIRRLDPQTRWLWISLLCIASDSPVRGYLLISKDLPYVVEDIADEAGMDVVTVTEGIKTLEKYGLIGCEENTYFIPKWEERQYDNPSDSPSATRERKRKSRQKYNSEQKSHDDVTTMSRVSHDIETETETDTELNNVVVVEEHPKPDYPESLTDEKFAQAYRAIEKQFYHAINSVQVDELSRFIDSGMEPELIEHAVFIAKKNSKGIDYFWGILQKCLDEGILSLPAFEQAKQDRKQRQLTKPRQDYRPKKDLPDWVANQPTKGVTAVLDPKKQQEADYLLMQLGEMKPEDYYAKWGAG